MKRIILLVLAVFIVLTAFAGCSKKSSTDAKETTTPEITTTPSDVVPEFDMDTWVSDGHVKVIGEQKIPENFVTDTKIYMAKNEKEAFNVSFRSDKSVEGLKLVLVEGNTAELQIEIFDEYLINTGRNKHYPDPLIPYTESFNVEENVTKTLLVRFVSNSDTKAGEHKFKFAAVLGSKTIAEYAVSVNVWDFALPEALTCESAVGLSQDMIFEFEQTSGSTAGKMLRAYYEMLLEYGLTANILPYQITNDKADEYLNDPRVTSIRIDIGLSDANMIKTYNKLKSNPEWLEKAYFYPYDEPNDMEALIELAERCKRLQELAPEIDIVIPFFKNIKVDETTDEIDYLDDYLGIWCPKAPAWTEKGWIGDPLNKGYFGDRMAEQKEQGDKIWWYVCWEPGAPYCNLYVNELGLNHVELFWQQYYYGVEGFLYWHTNYWKYVNPWENMATVPHLSEKVYGDGSLLYPGKPMGIEGPVASFRMECIRSGMEDYDLLLKAEELLGREWVVEQVQKVSESVTKHTKDSAVYAAARKAIGDAIEAELKK